MDFTIQKSCIREIIFHYIMGNIMVFAKFIGKFLENIMQLRNIRQLSWSKLCSWALKLSRIIQAGLAQSINYFHSVVLYSYALALVEIEQKLEKIGNSTTESCKYNDNVFREWYYCAEKIMFFLSDRTWKRTKCYESIEMRV